MSSGIVPLKGRIRTSNPSPTILWTKVSGPGTVAFSPSAAVANPTATISAAGAYVLRLSVTAYGFTETDDVTVIVKTNTAPVVSAGPDVAGSRATAILLAGAVTDDGLPAPSKLGSAWTKVSGPGNAVFASPTSANTTVTCDKGGTYVLRLTGTDGALTTTDDVTVTVATLGTTYAAALPIATPSSVALTDVEFRVDLSLMPTGWWSVVQSDGSDIRVSDVGENQLPCDPVIHFNKAAKTGFLVFKGTASGANTCYKIWCGGTAALPAVDSTFGQYNAYRDATIGFWPDGSGKDRTRNKNDMSPIAITPTTGTIGVTATKFGTNSDAYCGLTNPFTGPITLSAVTAPDYTGDVAFMNAASSATGSWSFVGTLAATAFRCRSGVGGNIGTSYGDCGVNAAPWVQMNGRFPSGGVHDAVTLVDSLGATSLVTSGPINFISIGSTGDGTFFYSGTSPVCLCECVNDNLSVEYLRYWELMLDQHTFWNSAQWALNSEPTQQFASLVFPTDWSHYAEATPDNPASTLTSVPMILDMSVLPNSWWLAATASGNDIRVSDGSNNLLAFDLIHYDAVGKTGVLVFNTTKTTSNQAYRIWQRTAGAAKLAATDTHGQYAAYPSHCLAFYPDGGGGDRTSHARHLTPTGGPTVSALSGPIPSGSSTSYNGTTQYEANATVDIAAYPVTIMGWGFNNNSVADHSLATTGVETLYFRADGKLAIIENATGATAATSASFTNSIWQHATGVFFSSTSRTVYLAGAASGFNATAGSGVTSHVTLAGTNGAGSLLNGRLALLSVHSTNLVPDWIGYNWQMGTPSTFWNTWTYV